jgi:hypothetical protein
MVVGWAGASLGDARGIDLDREDANAGLHHRRKFSFPNGIAGVDVFVTP